MLSKRMLSMVAVMVLLAASCGQGANQQGDPTATPSPSPVVTPSPSPTVSPDPDGDNRGDPSPVPDDEGGGDTLQAADVLSPGINTDRDEGEREGPSVVVTDVRVASHDGFDRVVFEIAGEGTAGWSVDYVDEPRAQGSGFPVEVEGDAYLSVSMSFISLPGDRPPGLEPWEGPMRIEMPGAGPVLEVVDNGLFEGYRIFFIGVVGEMPFQVRRFDSPQRVVVDVAGP